MPVHNSDFEEDKDMPVMWSKARFGIGNNMLDDGLSVTAPRASKLGQSSKESSPPQICRISRPLSFIPLTRVDGAFLLSPDKRKTAKLGRIIPNHLILEPLHRYHLVQPRPPHDKGLISSLWGAYHTQLWAIAVPRVRRWHPGESSRIQKPSSSFPATDNLAIPTIITQ